MKFIKNCCVLFLLVVSGCSTAQTFRIFYKPIRFDEERMRLTLEYLEKRHGLVQKEPVITPKMIVLHWTAIPDVERTFNAFNSATLPAARKGLTEASKLNVSSQFSLLSTGMVLFFSFCRILFSPGTLSD